MLGKSITKEFVNDMIQRFKDNKRIHKKYVFVPETEALLIVSQVYRITSEMKRLLMEEPTMLELSVQKGHTLTICGDTHGMLRSQIPHK